ncbi:hypothetical protein CHU92_04525 [Flavobacterium cyanobacteriorum]|uniref:DNA alkylation repair protein n=1 Tax=Flavobacterium cyanobacteriorum TaxID=2022802 RepID=A0A255ZGC4_9FLAO|nr:DNA alkylation repair protein [Flavobacterium cyanobacteriorum]OYQ40548.1 hypothetical protein CHU92_04525 [Flavobacterium cyanobacteriorum]
MSNFINELENVFTTNASAENAVAMEKYMKGHFPFFGIKTDMRRSLHKDIALKYRDELKQNAREVAAALYIKEQREYHYSAIDLLMKELKKNFRDDDIVLIEHLLVTKSWWDSVDLVSKYLLGGYLEQYPDKKEETVSRFTTSPNMWLNRSVLLFQLGYKNKTDQQLLFRECLRHKDSNEFFIQKAIGWALREYAKVNTASVKDFVAKAGLKPLSVREALKNA